MGLPLRGQDQTSIGYQLIIQGKRGNYVSEIIAIVQIRFITELYGSGHAHGREGFIIGIGVAVFRVHPNETIGALPAILDIEGVDKAVLVLLDLYRFEANTGFNWAPNGHRCISDGANRRVRNRTRL